MSKNVWAGGGTAESPRKALHDPLTFLRPHPLAIGWDPNTHSGSAAPRPQGWSSWGEVGAAARGPWPQRNDRPHVTLGADPRTPLDTGTWCATWPSGSIWEGFQEERI